MKWTSLFTLIPLAAMADNLSEKQCIDQYAAANQTFTNGLAVYRETDNGRMVEGTTEEQLCMLYYLWQQASGGYQDFNEDEGACWNVWGTWSPVSKKMYLDLCTRQIMF